MKLSPRYKWTVLVLFWFIYFMNQADRQVLFSVFPLIQREFGLTDASLGLLGSVFFWVYAVLVPVAGALGDRLARKNIVVFALLIWSAATAASGLVSGFALLLTFRALTGAGEAFYYPAANSIISDYHGRSTRALAMSIHQTSVYLGIVGSGTLAGYVGQVYGWRAAFLVFGVTGVVLAVLASRLLREPVRGAAEEEAAPPAEAGAPVTLIDHIRHAASSRTFWSLGAAFLCFKLVDAAYLAWMPTLLYRKFSLTLATAGFHATFWHHVGAFLGVLAGGRLSDRWALRSTLGRPLVQVAGLALGAPFIYVLGVSGEQAVVYAGLFLFGVFRGLYDSNLFASLYEVVRPASRATATGMMLCAAFLGGGTAPLVIGYFSRHFPLGQAMAYTSVLYLIGALIILADCGLWFRRDAARIHRAAPGYGAIMKIVDMRVRTVLLPIEAPLRHSTGVHPGRFIRTILELITDEGIVGLGEVGGGDQRGALLKLKPRLIGESPFDLERIKQKTLRQIYYLSNSRLYAAIEIACLDIQGKATGRSFNELLGGRMRDAVPFSAYLFYRYPEGDLGGETTPEEMVRWTKQLVAQYGFKSAKLKCGVLPPRHDINVILALRQEFGPDFGLRLDPNGFWSRGTAIHVAKALEDCRLEYLEDPTWGLEGMARVKERTTLPLATNMCVANFEHIAPAAAMNSVDIILSDIYYWEGPRGVKSLAQLCDCFRWGNSMHSGSELGVTMAAMIHTCASLHNLSYDADAHYHHLLDDIIVGGRMEPVDGCYAVPEGPGLGVALDEDRMAKYVELFEKEGDYYARFHEDVRQPGWFPVNPGW